MREQYEFPWSQRRHFGGSAARGLALRGASTLPFATDALFWMRGDDPGATVASGVYTAIPNRGTLGGQLSSVAGGGAAAGPSVTRAGGKLAPDFSAGECFEGTVDTLRTLHEPWTNAELFFVVSFSVGGSSCYVARDYPSGNLIGIHIERTAANALTFAVRDGTSQTLFLATANGFVVPGEIYIGRVRKVGNNFDLRVNGTLVTSGTASNLAAGASSMTAKIGAYSPTVAPVLGWISEMVLFGRTMTTDEAARVEAYLARWRRTFPFASDVDFWFRADDTAATFDSPLLILDPSAPGATVDGSGNFTAIPNTGSLGGTATPVSGAGPLRVTIDGVVAARTNSRTSDGGGLQIGGLDTFRALHEPTSICEIEFDVQLDPLTGAEVNHAWLLSTRDTVPGRRGVECIRYTTSGALNFRVDDGSTQVLSIQTPAIPPGRHLIRIAKRALTYSVFVDGELAVSGTASNLTSGQHYHVGCIGGRLNDAAGTQWSGAIFSVRLAPYDSGVGPTYLAIPNRGAAGGSMVPASGQGPEATTIGGKRAALTTTLGGLVFGNVDSLRFLHEPNTNAYLAFRFRVDNPASSTRLFGTKSSPATERGVFFSVESSFLIFRVSDGVTQTLQINVTGGALLANTQYTIELVKVGALFEVYRNGVLSGSGTASALTVGPHAAVPSFGSWVSDVLSLQGACCELLACRYAPTTENASAIRSQLARWAA